jgi:hypothetical protein
MVNNGNTEEIKVPAGERASTGDKPYEGEDICKPYNL